MNEEINLRESLPIYREYNNLIYDYFHKKINQKETLDEIISKIHPKFKTPIKCSSKFLTMKNDNKNKKIKYYKKPIYFIMNKSCIIKNCFYDIRNNKKIINLRKINHLDNNELTRDIILSILTTLNASLVPSPVDVVIFSNLFHGGLFLIDDELLGYFASSRCIWHVSRHCL
jgi:hypothetical protein